MQSWIAIALKSLITDPFDCCGINPSFHNLLKSIVFFFCFKLVNRIPIAIEKEACLIWLVWEMSRMSHLSIDVIALIWKRVGVCRAGLNIFWWPKVVYLEIFYGKSKPGIQLLTNVRWRSKFIQMFAIIIIQLWACGPFQ